MVRRRSAALLLAFAWAGLGPVVPIADAAAPVPTLKSTPPTSLAGSPARPHHHKAGNTGGPAPGPGVQAPIPSTTHTTPSGSLPMTGTDLPLELGIAGGFVALGLAARAAGRRRSWTRRIG